MNREPNPELVEVGDLEPITTGDVDLEPITIGDITDVTGGGEGGKGDDYVVWGS